MREIDVNKWWLRNYGDKSLYSIHTFNRTFRLQEKQFEANVSSHLCSKPTARAIYMRSNPKHGFDQWALGFLQKMVDLTKWMFLHGWLSPIFTMFTKINVHIKGPAKLRIFLGRGFINPLHPDFSMHILHTFPVHLLRFCKGEFV